MAFRFQMEVGIATQFHVSLLFVRFVTPFMFLKDHYHNLLAGDEHWRASINTGDAGCLGMDTLKEELQHGLQSKTSETSGVLQLPN